VLWQGNGNVNNSAADANQQYWPTNLLLLLLLTAFYQDNLGKPAPER